MAINFPTVSPGDVITAEQWNQVTAAIVDLYSQIGAVSNTQVAITGFMPPGPVKVGDQVTIQGRNFQYSIGAQSVFFGGAPINSFLLGSSDTQLVVNVPDPGNLPDQGQPVTVTVYNRSGSDSRQITVVPAPIPVVGSTPVSAVPFTGTPNAGATTKFSFVVTSNMSVARTLSVTATVSPSAWQGLVQMLTPGNQPLGQISLAPNASTPVVVALAIPAGTANGTPFSLTVNVTDVGTGNVVGSSATSSYSVAQASQVDPNIQFGKFTAIGGQLGALHGSTVTLAANTFTVLQVEVSFKAAAKYSVTAPLTSAAGWQTTMLDPPAGTPLDFTAGAPPTSTIRVRIDAQAAPTSGGQMQVVAQTMNQPLSTALGFTLAAG
jgi:hypothetical protein